MRLARASSLVFAAIAIACGAPAEPAPAPKSELPLETFLWRFPPAFCDFLSACKNDGVEVTVSVQMNLMSLAPKMKDASFGDRWERAKPRRRWRPTRDECTSQIALLAEGYSLTAASLKPRIGRTIRYDSVAAARCLAATKTPLPTCQQAKTVAPDEADLERFLTESGPLYSDHFGACAKVLVGLAETGQPCEDEFDCAGAATCPEHVCKLR